MTKDEAKRRIRSCILTAAEIYNEVLIGKHFLYIFDNRFIEVKFEKKNFCHLTGVCTFLPAREFYKKAINKTLNNNQFGFDSNHPFDLAKKKLKKFNLISELTNTQIIVTEDFTTNSFTYKFGLTNFEISIGMTENTDINSGAKIDGFFLPRTLRIKDKIVEHSDCSFFVDYIFMKANASSKYDKLLFGNNTKLINIPRNIIELIDLGNLQ